jgi:hypothetical protein
MKIKEVTNPLKTYLATVRVVLRGGCTTSKTTITADSANNALAMLTRLYGAGNVLQISMIVSESPQTYQIQAEATISPPSLQTRAQSQKIAQIQPSPVQQHRPTRQITTRPIATDLKHQVVQNKLTRNFMRQSNIVKPTSDDVRIAHDRAEIALKRADREYQKLADELLHAQKRASRR